MRAAVRRFIGPLLEKLQDFVGPRWEYWLRVQESHLFSWNPELEFRDVPLPQGIMSLASLPLVVDYSNIRSIKAKFSWSSLIGGIIRSGGRIKIEAEDAEVRLRFLYPSEWNKDVHQHSFVKKEQKKLKLWNLYGISTHPKTASGTLKETLKAGIMNMLDVSLKNAHITLVDDISCRYPSGLEAIVEHIQVSAPPQKDPRLTPLEAESMKRQLFQALWIRFLGFHIWYKEWSVPRMPSRKNMFTFVLESYHLFHPDGSEYGTRSLTSEEEHAKRIFDSIWENFNPQLKTLVQELADQPNIHHLHYDDQEEPVANRDSVLPEQPDPEFKEDGLHGVPYIKRKLRTRSYRLSMTEEFGSPTGRMKCNVKRRKKAVCRPPLCPTVFKSIRADQSCKPSEAWSSDDSYVDADEIYGNVPSIVFDPVEWHFSTPPTHVASTTDQSSPSPGVSTTPAFSLLRSRSKSATAFFGSILRRRTSKKPEEEQGDGKIPLTEQLRRYRVFDSTSERNLTDKNSYAWSVTGHHGLELHVMTKKWELAALSVLNLRDQPMKGTYLTFCAHKSIRRQGATAPPPSERLEDHDEMELNICPGAMEFIFSMIRHIEFYGAFIKGCSQPFKKIIDAATARQYLELNMKVLSGNNIKASDRAQYQKDIASIESKFRVNELMNLKEQAVRNVNRNASTPLQQPAAYADLFGSEIRDLASNPLSLNWFISEGITTIQLCNLKATFCPEVLPGHLVQEHRITGHGQDIPFPLKTTFPVPQTGVPQPSNPLDAELWKNIDLPKIRNALMSMLSFSQVMGTEYTHLGLYKNSFVVTMSMEIKIQKWTLDEKGTYIYFRNVAAYKTPHLIHLSGNPTLASNPSDWQLPMVLVHPQPVLELPTYLVVSPLATFPKNRDTAKLQCCLRRVGSVHDSSLPPTSVFFNIEEEVIPSPGPSSSGSFPIPISVDITLDGDQPCIQYGSKTCRFRLTRYWKSFLTSLDPEKDLLIAIEDRQQISNRWTQIIVPPIFADFAEAVDLVAGCIPSMKLTRELLRDHDNFVSEENTGITNVGYNGSSVFKDMNVWLPAIRTTMIPKSLADWRYMRVLAEICSLGSINPRSSTFVKNCESLLPILEKEGVHDLVICLQDFSINISPEGLQMFELASAILGSHRLTGAGTTSLSSIAPSVLFPFRQCCKEVASAADLTVTVIPTMATRTYATADCSAPTGAPDEQLLVKAGKAVLVNVGSVTINSLERGIIIAPSVHEFAQLLDIEKLKLINRNIKQFTQHRDIDLYKCDQFPDPFKTCRQRLVNQLTKPVPLDTMKELRFDTNPTVLLLTLNDLSLIQLADPPALDSQGLAFHITGTSGLLRFSHNSIHVNASIEEMGAVIIGVGKRSTLNVKSPILSKHAAQLLISSEESASPEASFSNLLAAAEGSRKHENLLLSFAPYDPLVSAETDGFNTKVKATTKSDSREMIEEVAESLGEFFQNLALKQHGETILRDRAAHLTTKLRSQSNQLSFELHKKGKAMDVGSELRCIYAFLEPSSISLLLSTVNFIQRTLDVMKYPSIMSSIEHMSDPTGTSTAASIPTPYLSGPPTPCDMLADLHASLPSERIKQQLKENDMIMKGLKRRSKLQADKSPSRLRISINLLNSHFGISAQPAVFALCNLPALSDFIHSNATAEGPFRLPYIPVHEVGKDIVPVPLVDYFDRRNARGRATIVVRPTAGLKCVRVHLRDGICLFRDSPKGTKLSAASIAKLDLCLFDNLDILLLALGISRVLVRLEQDVRDHEGSRGVLPPLPNSPKTDDADAVFIDKNKLYKLSHTIPKRIIQEGWSTAVQEAIENYYETVFAVKYREPLQTSETTTLSANCISLHNASLEVFAITFWLAEPVLPRKLDFGARNRCPAHFGGFEYEPFQTPICNVRSRDVSLPSILCTPQPLLFPSGESSSERFTLTPLLQSVSDQRVAYKGENNAFGSVEHVPLDRPTPKPSWTYFPQPFLSASIVAGMAGDHKHIMGTADLNSLLLSVSVRDVRKLQSVFGDTVSCVKRCIKVLKEQAMKASPRDAKSEVSTNTDMALPDDLLSHIDELISKQQTLLLNSLSRFNQLIKRSCALVQIGVRGVEAMVVPDTYLYRRGMVSVEAVRSVLEASYDAASPSCKLLYKEALASNDILKFGAIPPGPHTATGYCYNLLATDSSNPAPVFRFSCIAHLSATANGLLDDQLIHSIIEPLVNFRDQSIQLLDHLNSSAEKVPRARGRFSPLCLRSLIDRAYYKLTEEYIVKQKMPVPQWSVCDSISYSRPICIHIRSVEVDMGVWQPIEAYDPGPFVEGTNPEALRYTLFHMPTCDLNPLAPGPDNNEYYWQVIYKFNVTDLALTVNSDDEFGQFDLRLSLKDISATDGNGLPILISTHSELEDRVIDATISPQGMTVEVADLRVELSMQSIEPLKQNILGCLAQQVALLQMVDDSVLPKTMYYLCDECFQPSNIRTAELILADKPNLVYESVQRITDHALELSVPVVPQTSAPRPADHYKLDTLEVVHMNLFKGKLQPTPVPKPKLPPKHSSHVDLTADNGLNVISRVRADFRLRNIEIWMCNVTAHERRLATYMEWYELSGFQPLSYSHWICLGAESCDIGKSYLSSRCGKSDKIIVSAFEENSPLLINDGRQTSSSHSHNNLGGGELHHSALLKTLPVSSPRLPSWSVCYAERMNSAKRYDDYKSLKLRHPHWRKKTPGSAANSEFGGTRGEMRSDMTAGGDCIFALWLSTRGSMVRIDDDEMQCEFSLSSFIGMAGTAINAVGHLTTPPSVVGYVSGRRLNFQELSEQRLATDLKDEFEDIALSLPMMKVDSRIVRCFQKGSAGKPMPEAFKRIQMPLAHDDSFTLNKNLFVSTGVLFAPLLLQISTHHIKEWIVLVQNLVDCGTETGKILVGNQAKTNGSVKSPARSPFSSVFEEGGEVSPKYANSLFGMRGISSRSTGALLSTAIPRDVTEKDAQHDSEALENAYKVSAVVYDSKYDNHVPRIRDPKEISQVLQKYPVAQPKSRSAIGKFLWELLASRYCTSVILHLKVSAPHTEILMKDRGLTTLRLISRNFSLSGPLPLIGQSYILADTSAEILALNLNANREEPLLTAPLNINLKAERRYVTARSIPTMEVSGRVSAIQLVLDAGTAQNLYRLSYSLTSLMESTQMGGGRRRYKSPSQLAIINTTGNHIGITIQQPVSSAKTSNATTNPKAAVRFATTTVDGPTSLDAKLIGVCELSANDYFVEDSRYELFFSVRRMDASGHHSPSVSAEDEVAVQIEPTILAAANSNTITTPRQLAELWRDLSQLGDSEFMTVTRILLEDDELREKVKEAVAHSNFAENRLHRIYRMISQDQGGSAINSSVIVGRSKDEVSLTPLQNVGLEPDLVSLIRNWINQRKPYRSILAENQRDLLFSTSRHVETILDSIIKESPFLLSSKIAQLTSANLHSQMFKQTEGWVSCGMLRLTREGPKAYHVDGLGYRVMVDPQMSTMHSKGPDAGHLLYIGSTVLVENATPFKLVINCKGRANRFRHLAHRLLNVHMDGLPRPVTKMLMTLRDRMLYTEDDGDDIKPDHHSSDSELIIEPFKKISIPLNWFNDPRGKLFTFTVSSTQANTGKSSLDDLQELLSVLETSESISQLDKTGDSIALVIKSRLQKLLKDESYINIGKHIVFRRSIKYFHLPAADKPEMIAGYIYRIEPALQIRNHLSVPITITISPHLNASVRINTDAESADSAPDVVSAAVEDVEGMTAAEVMIYNSTVDEIYRLFNNMTITASIPSNWTWCLPLSLDTIDVRTYVHGLPLQRCQEYMTLSAFKSAQGSIISQSYGHQILTLAQLTFPDIPAAQIAQDLLMHYGIWSKSLQANEAATALPMYDSGVHEIWLQGAMSQYIDARISNPQVLQIDSELNDICTIACNSVGQSIFGVYPLEIVSSRQGMDIISPTMIENTFTDLYVLVNGKPIPPLSALSISSSELIHDSCRIKVIQTGSDHHIGDTRYLLKNWRVTDEKMVNLTNRRGALQTLTHAIKLPFSQGNGGGNMIQENLYNLRKSSGWRYYMNKAFGSSNKPMFITKLTNGGHSLPNLHTPSQTDIIGGVCLSVMTKKTSWGGIKLGFGPYYNVYSRLPFNVILKSADDEDGYLLRPCEDIAIHNLGEWIMLQSASSSWCSRRIFLDHGELPCSMQIEFVNYTNTEEYLLLQINLLSSEGQVGRSGTIPGRWLILSVPSTPQFLIRNDMQVPLLFIPQLKSRSKRPILSTGGDLERKHFDSAADWLRYNSRVPNKLLPGEMRVLSILPWEQADHTMLFRLVGNRKEKWASHSVLDASSSEQKTVWEILEEGSLQPMTVNVYSHTTVNKEGVRILRIWSKGVGSKSGSEDDSAKIINKRGRIQTAFVRAKINVVIDGLGLAWRISNSPVLQANVQNVSLTIMVSTKENLMELFELRQPMQYIEDAAEQRRKRRHYENTETKTIDLDLLPLILRPINHGRDYYGAVSQAQIICERVTDELCNRGVLTALLTVQSMSVEQTISPGRPVVVTTASSINKKLLSDIKRSTQISRSDASGSTRNYEQHVQSFFMTSEEFHSLTKKALVGFVRKQLLAPTHASVYETLAVICSPVLANIELEVIEAIVKSFESEKSIVKAPYFYSMSDRQGVSEGRSIRSVPPRLSKATLLPAPVHSLRDVKTYTGVYFRVFKTTVALLTSQQNAGSGFVMASVVPRIADLAHMNAVYLENVKCSPFNLQISIRTSGQKIDRSILWIADALPLDSPYMAISVPAWERKLTVATWHEIMLRAKNDYLQALFKKSLPSVWLYYIGAPVVGTMRGLRQLTVLVNEERKNRPWEVVLSGSWTGARLGLVLAFLGLFGGAFHFISHLADVVHRLFRGRRARPTSILDGFNKGVRGFVTDLCWNPWHALVVNTRHHMRTEAEQWKVCVFVMGRVLRCLMSPLMASLHLVASISEGFATALIGDFDRLKLVDDVDKAAK